MTVINEQEYVWYSNEFCHWVQTGPITIYIAIVIEDGESNYSIELTFLNEDTLSNISSKKGIEEIKLEAEIWAQKIINNKMCTLKDAYEKIGAM